MDARTDLQPIPPFSTSRRAFIQSRLGFPVASAAVGVAVPLSGPSRVASLTDVPVPNAQVIPVDNHPVTVVNTAEGGVNAFSAICTHLGGVVDWNKSKNVIQSPCHDGHLNLVTGAVVSGPPPRPIPPYELMVKDGKIYVGKPLGQIYRA